MTTDDQVYPLQYAEYPATTSNTNDLRGKLIFSGFFIAYLECASNLEHLEKKDEHLSPVISEIIDSEQSW